MGASLPSGKDCIVIRYDVFGGTSVPSSLLHLSSAIYTILHARPENRHYLFLFHRSSLSCHGTIQLGCLSGDDPLRDRCLIVGKVRFPGDNRNDDTTALQLLHCAARYCLGDKQSF